MRLNNFILLLTLACVAALEGHAQNFWQPTGGPNGARVRSLAFNNAGDAFAGTINTGVFRQSSGAPSWSAVNTGLGDSLVYALGVSPTGLIVAGTSHGIYRSANNGTNWTPSSLTTDIILCLAIKSPAEMYAGVGAGNTGAYKSTNDGATWQPLSLAGVSVGSIAIHPVTGSIFAGTLSDGIARSTDNGVSWVPVNSGLNDLVIFSLAAAPNGNIYAGTQNGGIYISVNNGATWVPAGTGIPSPTIFALATNTAGHVLAGITNGIFRSTDNGASWVPVNTGLTDFQIQALGFDRRNIGYAGTLNGLVSRTTSSTVPPAPPSLLSPPDGASNYPINVAFVWNASVGAGTYHIQLSTNPAFTAIVLEDSTLTDTTRSAGPLLTSTTYYWRVRAKSLGGVSAYSPTWSFTTVVAPPPVPVLVSPPDGSTNQPTTLTMSWNASAGASTYRLQVSGNATFTAIVFDDSTIDVLSSQVGPLLNSTTYYWRVRAKNIGGVSAFSTPRSFTTITAPPPAPSLVSPTDGATNQPTTLTMNWNASTGATTYRLQVSTNAAFTAIVFDDSTIGGTSRQVGPLLNNAIYFWRVNARNAGGTSPYSAAWSFRTIGVPGFSVSAASIFFGNVVVNSSRQDSVIVTNTGTSALTVSSVTSSNPRFSVSPASAIIAAQTSKPFAITFSPDAQSVFAATIIFTHDAPGSPDTVAVSGTGVQSFFSVTPASLNFGNVSIGATRRDSLRVANLGNPPITISSVSSSNAQYSILPPNAVVFSGQSVWFYVTFAPTVGGTVGSSISFVHDAAGSPTSVAVSGVGLAPGFDPQPSNLPFGNAVVGTTKRDSITVTNTGSIPLNVASIASTNGRFASLTAPFGLGQGQSRTVILTFSPGNVGLQNGDIIFTHNAPGSPDSVHVSGTGVAPGWSVSPQSIAFGSVPVSGSKKDSVTVSNPGTSSLAVSSIVSTDQSFTVVPPGATIPPLDSTKFYFTFAPASAGLRNAGIVFFHNAAGSPDTVAVSGTGVVAGFSANPPVLSFGNLLVGGTKQDSVIVSNTGLSPLDISLVTSSNTRFTVNPTNAAIPPGGTRRFDVAFAPTVTGPLSASIVFNHNGPTQRDTVHVSGVGVAPGLLVVPRPLSFPAVGVGSSVDGTVKLFNSGTASLRVDSARVRGPQAPEFVITSPSGPFPLLAPSDSITMTIRFTPQDSVLRSAVLIISSNAGSSPDSVAVTGRGRAALVRVVLTGDTTAGNPLNIGATPTGNIVVDSAKVYYRNAGKQAYDSLRLTPNGTIYQGVFPSSVVNARGIEYFVTFFTGQGPVNFPENNPVANPAVVRVKVLTLQSPLVLKRRVYKMISVPLDLNNPTVPGVLFDDYNPYDRSRWRLFRWENNANIEYPALGTTFTPGTSFWLITQSGIPFDVDGGRSVNSALPATIVLPQGWSQIACPYIFPVAWGNVQNSGALRGPFYYTNGQYVPNVGTLMPWEGYFVRNDSGSAITLSVPAVEAPPAFPKSIVPAVRTQDAYILQLSAVAGELEDTYNYAGFMEGALVGEDRLDIPEPPLMGDYLDLSIIENGQRYIGDFKPRGDSGQFWEMEIVCTVPNQVVNLALTETGVLPDGFNMYVLDRDEFRAIPVSDRAWSVQLNGESVRRLQLIIGTEGFASQHAGGIPLTPLDYALDQNFPNPFNPSTTIRYQLNKRGIVSLEVFNILGQRVRALVHGEQPTGAYSVLWDGRNDAGRVVASGMYLYRLSAGEFISTRKLILLR